jgi:hypothetical protein
MAGNERVGQVDDAAWRVIQASKPEPRIMRYELTDFEWSAIKPFLWVSGRFWRRVIRQAYNVNVTGSILSPQPLSL